MFKYYDTHALGHIDFKQFYQAMEKLGFQYEESKMQEIFSACDTDQSGSLDYREFVCMFLGEEAATKGHIAPKADNSQKVNQLLAVFKLAVMKRGAKGIIGLQRVFKICDDDESGALNRAEFSKALREYKIEISDE